MLGFIDTLIVNCQFVAFRPTTYLYPDEFPVQGCIGLYSQLRPPPTTSPPSSDFVLAQLFFRSRSWSCFSLRSLAASRARWLASSCCNSRTAIRFESRVCWVKELLDDSRHPAQQIFSMASETLVAAGRDWFKVYPWLFFPTVVFLSVRNGAKKESRKQTNKQTNEWNRQENERMIR